MTSSSAPDLIALELLDSIAELGSLGRAATRHGMSQPAVSQRMTQLERVLGIRLLRRSRAGTTLTPAGEQVAVMARRVLREMRALMAGVTALAAEEDARLRVAASLTVAEYLLPGWLSALRQESPDVILAVAVSNSSQVLTQVRDGSADVGFVEGSQAPQDGLAVVTVRSDRLVVVVHPGHPWARRASPVTGAELAAADLIVREPGSGTRQVLDRALRSWGGAHSWLELGSTATILAAARRGEGPAVLSALAVTEDVDAGRLVPVQAEGIDLSRALRAVWPSDRPLAPLARRLLNLASHKAPL
ncbi:MAG TPA: LysR family transcriptional regulator [Trebonia sp.]|jgi:DNA-binding transcriptional LysR family regulator|nr:LysR family transcriptional regulator [Trebonia sp.]